MDGISFPMIDPIFGSPYFEHPPHGQGPGVVSGPSGYTADETAPAEETEWEVDIHFGSDGTRGGGFLTMEE